MKWTLEQLKLADELCFPEDARELFKKHLGDDWIAYHLDYKREYKGGLLKWIFHFSRNDLTNNNFGARIDKIIEELIN